MSWITIVASVVPAAVTLGGGLYKLGSGLMAMATTVKELVAYHEDHEARIKALETAAAARSRRAPRSLVRVTIETRRCNKCAGRDRVPRICVNLPFVRFACSRPTGSAGDHHARGGRSPRAGAARRCRWLRDQRSP